jgi:hypothetical protein
MNIYQVANKIIETLGFLDIHEVNVVPSQSVETDVNGKESAGFALWLNGEAFNVNVTRSK